MARAFDINQLEIDGDRAKLESLRGKCVGRLAIHIHRSDDAEHVASCKSVERLELWGWKGADLTALQGLAVRYLRLVRGQQTSTKGLNTKRLKKLWVHSCGKLRTLDIAGVPWLWVWACNNLNLDSLSAIHGLVGLDIGPRREIRSLAFVGKCRYLKCLMIDTHSWKTQDFRPLVRAPALELAGFTRLELANVEAISKANPKLFIGVIAANSYMQGGCPMTKADSLKRRRAFNKKYGV